MSQYTYRYPHPAVTTDCVVFGYDGLHLNVLLIERGGEPYKGYWAFPGGFLNIDEDAPDGARRELLEETGLEATDIEQLGAFASPDRDPRERVISIAYFTLTRVKEVKEGDDALSSAIQQLSIKLILREFLGEHLFKILVPGTREIKLILFVRHNRTP